MHFSSEREDLVKFTRASLTTGKRQLPDSLKAFVRVIESCLDDEPKKRPTMAQVALQLEFTLEQQDSPKSLVPNEIGVAEPILLASTGKQTRASTDEQNVASPPEEQTNTKMENVVPPSEERNDRTTPIYKQQLEFALEQQDSPKSLVPNEIGVPDVLPATDEPILLASTGKVTRAFTDEQNVASTPKEQTNSKMDNVEPPSEERDDRTTTMHKQPRSWLLDVFSKLAKPLAKKDLEVSISGQNELLNERQDSLTEDYGTDVKVTQFDWITIVAATNRFANSNIISSRGRTNTVYKAVLPTRQTVAVKRIHQCSVYEYNEFKDDISFLSKLQHPNIMKLLGYCSDRGEMILVSEFMKNKSLDSVIHRRNHLPWTHRFKIIVGIARGVLYLHQHFPFRRLHWNLKPRNILLDSAMNPKIALNFKNKEEVKKVVGSITIMLGDDDYASPEFGLFDWISVPSDMYSFGVIVLEIVSGKRHRRSSKDHPNLITWAWELWNKERALDLMDAAMGEEFSKEEALKCIQICLLCTQEEQYFRPRMPLVLRALEGDQDLQLELKEAASKRK